MFRILHSSKTPVGILRYKISFKKYGKNTKSLGWVNKKAQTDRFRELIKDIDLEGKTILDFGCGTGDIITILSDKYSNIEYTGVDIVPEFIDAAEKAYNIRTPLSNKFTVKFLLRDLIKHPLRRKFDVVLCSGALNSNINDAVGYRKKAIKILWEHAEYALAFNMAGGFPQPENKNINRVWYADSLEILKYCLSLSSKTIFRHHYRVKDFTVIMFR